MVRHGQSTNNVVRDNPGAARTSDPDLTDLGHQQAEALGTWMAANGPRPGRIFCSLMRRTIQTAHPWIGHYHTAGNPGRAELDDHQELNYPPIFQAIAATGYTGYLGHEFIPRGEPVAGLRAAFELAKLA